MANGVVGRPPKPIDWDEVDEFLEAGAPGTEIASYFNISHDQFYIRIKEKYGISFHEYQAEKRGKGNIPIRKSQYDKAIAGDNMMLIWLGKNRLGQKDNHENIEATKQNDLDLKQKYYAVLYELQQLKDKLNAIEPQASQELQ